MSDPVPPLASRSENLTLTPQTRLEEHELHFTDKEKGSERGSDQPTVTQEMTESPNIPALVVLRAVEKGKDQPRGKTPRGSGLPAPSPELTLNQGDQHEHEEAQRDEDQYQMQRGPG